MIEKHPSLANEFKRWLESGPKVVGDIVTMPMNVTLRTEQWLTIKQFAFVRGVSLQDAFDDAILHNPGIGEVLCNLLNDMDKFGPDGKVASTSKAKLN
ncbi:MAG TPA: hypothetical protein VGO67_03050 [Verrucomicrobiae bacterium]|jgi:hypothetical protein